MVEKDKAPKKSKEEQPKAEFEKYAYANLAAQFAGSEQDAKYTTGALSLLRKNLSLGGKDAEILYENVSRSEEGMKILLDTYAGAYAEEKNKASAMDLFSWYQKSGALKGASPDQVNLFRSEFSKIGEDYGTVMQKAISAEHTLQGLKKGLKVSKDDQDKAQKVLEKYGKFLKIQRTVEDYTTEGMRSKAVEASQKDVFGGLEKTLAGKDKE